MGKSCFSKMCDLAAFYDNWVVNLLVWSVFKENLGKMVLLTVERLEFV